MSKNDEKTRDIECDVLTRAMPLLNRLYGEVTVDESQTDRPDAAFFYSRKLSITHDPGVRKIGIEITSIDRPEDRQYFEDEKMARKATLARLEEIRVGSAKPPDGPLKSKSIPFANDYIYEGIKGKAKLYAGYMDAGNFEQIVLLFTSEFLGLDNPDFNYLARWADHLLGKIRFPFGKVIFVCKRTDSSKLIFDKDKPARREPARKLNREQGETHLHSQIFPLGESNLGGTFTGEPLVPPKKRRRK